MRFQSPEEAIRFIDDIPNIIHDTGIFLDDSNIGMDYIEVYELHPNYVDTSNLRNKNMEELFKIGKAVEEMEAGNKVARASRNGKGMHIYLVPASSYPSHRNINGTCTGEYEDDMVPYTAYIAMKTPKNEMMPWNASQSDLLGDDWYIVN